MSATTQPVARRSIPRAFANVLRELHPGANLLVPEFQDSVEL
jgi:hypothetical protein